MTSVRLRLRRQIPRWVSGERGGARRTIASSFALTGRGNDSRDKKPPLSPSQRDNDVAPNQDPRSTPSWREADSGRASEARETSGQACKQLRGRGGWRWSPSWAKSNFGQAPRGNKGNLNRQKENRGKGCQRARGGERRRLGALGKLLSPGEAKVVSAPAE